MPEKLTNFTVIPVILQMRSYY